ncbi:hypothetical protein BE21_02645 [Sorangium cellulosum]|uniref:Uncharacterized protein n=2 Tax=Sorangium cellulosum TaxID=56 RepID=A0A150TR63_SORCE|nr:hypothetical protein SCE1572_30620 [Sorangium cellulosum So0157-2]KYG07182.1 hypothetical protein BE21_02645 [Sorangium cellulosum]
MLAARSDPARAAFAARSDPARAAPAARVAGPLGRAACRRARERRRRPPRRRAAPRAPLHSCFVAPAWPGRIGRSSPSEIATCRPKAVAAGAS